MMCALHRLHRKDSRKELRTLKNFFLYRRLHLYFFPQHEFDGLIFAGASALTVSRIVFASTATLMLLYNTLFTGWEIFLVIVILVTLEFLFGEFLPRILGNQYSVGVLHYLAPIASPYLMLAFPLTYFSLKIANRYWKKNVFNYLNEFNIGSKQEIIEIIQDADLNTDLNAHEKKLISSAVSFREKIAREVMVPRVDLFCLKAGTTIKEAATLIENEGYSRVPVYKQNMDDIIGLLMYKDLLVKYKEYEQKDNNPKILEAPIDTIIKPPLYAPETKKISNLLQEFRKKQVHLAIIVDEYGSTEGIVTIEDILEEIVGEIEDEYDEEEDLFVAHPDGSWIVDARMTVLDMEEQLGITIPQEGEYDTIGGYIFHHAGSIPSKGFVIQHDDFTLEILRSNDRFVEKVRIKPIKKPPSEKLD